MSLGPIYANIFAGERGKEKRIFRGYLAACPRAGDTLRYGSGGIGEIVEVTEVIWCLDEQIDGEPIHKVMRVNIRAEPEK